MKVSKDKEQRLLLCSCLLNNHPVEDVMPLEEAAALFGVSKSRFEGLIALQDTALISKLDPLVQCIIRALTMPEYSIVYLQSNEEVVDFGRIVAMARSGGVTVEALRPWAISTFREMRIVKNTAPSIVDGVLRCTRKQQTLFDAALNASLNLMVCGKVKGTEHDAELVESLCSIRRNLGSMDSEYWSLLKSTIVACCKSDIQLGLVNFCAVQMPDLYPMYKKHGKLAWWENSLHENVITISDGNMLRISTREFPAYV